MNPAAFPEPEGQEIELVCTELGPALELLRALGLLLDELFPADEPHTAIFSHAAAKVRLTTRPGEARLSDLLPSFKPEFILSRSGGEAGEGRAGMRYRDLIPGRLGGRYIASLISIPDGGPVADWVHYHAVAFQMIAVRSGWVRVVYEDQGEPFVMEAGDVVLQPPLIRHRVLESSKGLEVVEIGCPAIHKTFSEHVIELPTATVDEDRVFAGQRFLHHRAAETPWTPIEGGEAQVTAMGQATAGLAEVRTIRPAGATSIPFKAHDGELVFGFVLEGKAQLAYRNALELGSGDAFVIPPGDEWALRNPTPDLRLLHVTTAHIPDEQFRAGIKSA